MNNRDYAIDILKFVGAILITNSHFDLFEPRYPLATGGTMGDILFLFCSGYTLFMGQTRRFDNWYKRRLKRIYPPVICWGILAAFMLGADFSIKYVMLEGGGWFVQCILIYYIIAYPIRKYLINNLWEIMLGTLVVVCIWFSLIDKSQDFILYGWNYCKWAAFFLFFLQGAIMGYSQVTSNKKKHMKYYQEFLVLVFCIVMWYAILFIQQKYRLSVYLQLLSLLFLFPISSSLLNLCRTNIVEKAYNHKIFGSVIKGIGGLCFEIYLVQTLLFKVLKGMFVYPINLGLMWITIFACAYMLHVFTNFCVQTLSESNYDWKKIFKIY